MRPDIFSHGDSILLLGEGNFSFSLGLLSLGLQLKLTATCFESALTEKQIANSQILKSNGACVLTNVDATKVHEHSFLMTMKYDIIIFNFPHTGGKMKIHLNRKLLHDFFMSASNLMVKQGGCILVSLCRGQGADFKNKRIWADSWQVADMAGHANLLLVECSPFQWEYFPTYTNVGYRSLEKGFHSKDAFVHKFCFVSTPLDHQSLHVLDYYSNEFSSSASASLRPIFDRKIKQGILNNSRSPSFYILKQLESVACSEHTVQHHIRQEPFIDVLKDCDIASGVHLWNLAICELFLFSFYILHETGLDFNKAPVSTQTLIFGNNSYSIFQKFLARLMKIFGFSENHIFGKINSYDSRVIQKIFFREMDKNDDILLADYFYVYHNGSHQFIVLIYLDNIVTKFFSLQNWHQVWADNLYVNCLAQHPVVGGICPYPVIYTFDISFIIPDSFSEEKLLQVLWDLAGEVLVNVSKVSEFSSSSGEISFCYRLSYLSYDLPMCRKKVLEYHQNVVGGALTQILGVLLK